MVLPSFDVTLQLHTRGSLQVQLEPGLNAVERGKLLEGETILITEVSKVNTGHNQAHLLLHQWKSSNSHVDCISTPTPPIVLSSHGVGWRAGAALECGGHGPSGSRGLHIRADSVVPDTAY